MKAQVAKEAILCCTSKNWMKLLRSKLPVFKLRTRMCFKFCITVFSQTTAPISLEWNNELVVTVDGMDQHVLPGCFMYILRSLAFIATDGGMRKQNYRFAGNCDNCWGFARHSFFNPLLIDHAWQWVQCAPELHQCARRAALNWNHSAEFLWKIFSRPTNVIPILTGMKWSGKTCHCIRY